MAENGEEGVEGVVAEVGEVAEERIAEEGIEGGRREEGMESGQEEEDGEQGGMKGDEEEEGEQLADDLKLGLVMTEPASMDTVDEEIIPHTEDPRRAQTII
ncbi:MAG: hypothetical protein Q9192_007740 [Flavoplaca navasiana]